MGDWRLLLPLLTTPSSCQISGARWALARLPPWVCVMPKISPAGAESGECSFYCIAFTDGVGETGLRVIYNSQTAQSSFKGGVHLLLQYPGLCYTAACYKSATGALGVGPGPRAGEWWQEALCAPGGGAMALHVALPKLSNVILRKP